MRLDVSAAFAAVGTDVPFSLSEDVPAQQWDGDTLEFVTPLAVTGVCAVLGDHVMVRASVSARVKAPCASCLEDALADLTAKLDQTYAREVDPEDQDLLPFEGHQVELTEPALAALFLEIPMRILCRPDCKGLCPRCGQNQNVTQCSCQKELPVKQPFSALASLLTKDEEV